MGAVAGVDFDTRAVHVVLVDLDGLEPPAYYRFDLSLGHDAFERTRSIREAMPARTSVFWSRVLAIGLEEPRGPGNGSLLRMQGAILACLPHATVVDPLAPNEWRKTVGLNGRASKDLVAIWSVAAGAPSMWPQDAHDAHAIARAVAGRLEATGAARAA